MKIPRDPRQRELPQSPLRLGLRATFFFCLAFAGVILVLSTAADTLRTSFVNLTARFTAALLTVLGAGAQSRGSLLTTRYGSVEIVYECTELYPLVIVVAAILAFPCGWRAKVLGMGLGSLMVLVLNQVRILSLIYLDHFVPEATETVHQLVWPALMLLSMVVFFVTWAKDSLDGS